MKVYIATAFANVDGFRKAKAALEAEGHTITHDWTSEDAVPEGDAEKAQFLHDAAVKDAFGIASADVFLMLVEPVMAGTYVELGIALTVSCHVIVVGKDNPGNRDCIFFHLFPIKGMLEYVNTLEEALDAIGDYVDVDPSAN